MRGGIRSEAPAKLNLTLRVLGRRDDGFHEIDSLMVALPGLHDRLEVRPVTEDRFECSDPDLPTDGSNLVLRARDAFREATGIRDGLSIRLEKRIPHGAGLGGGSSDAAATLRALDRCFGEPLGAESLADLAAGIGSDVPFFLGGPAARVRGRGEKIEPAAAPGGRVLLLKPAFGVSTPDAYGGWRDAAEIPGIPYAAQQLGRLELLNDLERPVFAKFRFLAEVKLWLLQRPEVEGALMSGSGSTMFACLQPRADAGTLVAEARRELDPGLWAWSGDLPGEA